MLQTKFGLFLVLKQSVWPFLASFYPCFAFHCNFYLATLVRPCDNELFVVNEPELMKCL